MSKIKFSIFLLFIIQSIFAQKTVATSQYSAIDKIALQLPDSISKTTAGIASYINAKFKNDADKIRAIFIWTATNIQYDIENIYAINFYESEEDKINKALANRKGICQNYAAVFNDVCIKTGIKSFVIDGYTRQSGFTDYIPHQWCVAYVDTSWVMVDPTWGSGYVSGGTFHKRIDNNYFKVHPAMLIKTHMPFDYLWQFLNYPVTNQEFYEGKTGENKQKPFFNFTDSIALYEQQSRIEQLQNEARRIEKNGLKNSMIFDRLQHIKMEIENDKVQAENERQNKLAAFYNSAAANYNEAVNVFNAFIDYRNHQFKPEKTDTEIQAMLDSTNSKLTSAKNNLNAVKDVNENMQTQLTQFQKSIADLDIHIKEQQDWLNEYFSKSRSKRKLMFYDKKITWFGVPLN
ncbi:MAG: hypothetical protein JO072_16360 [Parafilimonas sp.]|nr:hypothetical protein [Parafilimonas sp.]